MEGSKKQQLLLFLFWIVTVPPGLFIAYNYFPSGDIDWLNIVLLFSILFLTMLIPLHIQNVSITLEKWVTFAIFFNYGLFTEIVFTQIGILILLFSGKSATPIFNRFFINSGMFMITSIVSAQVFILAGGSIGMQSFSDVFYLGLLYALTYTLLNNVLLKAYFYFNERSYSLMSKGALWDYVTTLIMLPFSISLYFLQEHLNNKSLFLVGIPFLLVLFVVRRYTNSNGLNVQLSHAGEIGHELADRLRVDEVMETFLKMLKDVVPFDNAYIVDLRGDVKLKPLMGLEIGVVTKQVEGIAFLGDMKEEDGLSLDFSKIYHNPKEVARLRNIKFTHLARSVITTPIKRNHKTVGFLVLTSNKKNMFRLVEIKIIDILAGYLAISLENAKYFEKTIDKSMRCGLTNLHNYRYLDAKLDEEIIRYHTNEITNLSLIMIDIDHFKKINDTYGHESGNDLLCDISSVLQNFVDTNETLARYGGEEFVIVLPDASKDQAAELAEMIRSEIENTVFTVVPDLSKVRTLIEVKMTISIGVATLPEDAGGVKDLMRNADRALYIGGKQAGRNRVGVFGRKYIVTL